MNNSGLIINIGARTGIRYDILEKDYYVTLILKELSKNQHVWKAYFKGGTALYKSLSSINRFSEDIDLTVFVDDLESNNQKKIRLEKSAEGYTSLERVVNDPDNNKFKGSITTIYKYPFIFGDDISDPLQRFGRVKIEATSFSVSEPIESVKISPVLFEEATDEEKIILEEQFDVSPFELLTIKLERIFIDKVFATEFYYQRYKNHPIEEFEIPNNFAFDVAKHIYDLMILLNNEKIKLLLNNDKFLKHLISLKRQEELARKGGIPSDIKICEFSYLNQLLEDQEFRKEYLRMQEIYVFRNEDKIPLERAIHVIEAIRSIKE